MITDPSAATAAVPVARPRAGQLRPRRPQWGGRAGRLLGRHWIFAALFGAGLGLRVITQIAYRPALFYIDSYKYPYSHYQPPAGMTKHQVVGDFVARVAMQQPLSMPLSVLRDGARLFALTRDGLSTITPISRWQFQPAYATFPPGVTLKFVAEQGQHYGGGGPVTIRPLAAFLHDYQLHGGYTPGPLLAVMLAAGAAGSLFVFGRRRGTGTLTADDRLLATGTLLATLSAVTIVLGSDVFEFSWRYQLPALVTLPLAGVLGGTLLARGAEDLSSGRSWRRAWPRRPGATRTRWPAGTRARSRRRTA